MSSDKLLPSSHSGEPRQLVDILHRFFDHWFGPKAYGWSLSDRVACGSAGSVTFFLAWGLHIFASTGIGSVPDLRAAFYLLWFLVLLLGTPWFAFLVAWKDLNYGPVRLYLSGFLLPYFVWSLIVLMLGRKLPELAL